MEGGKNYVNDRNFIFDFFRINVEQKTKLLFLILGDIEKGKFKKLNNMLT